MSQELENPLRAAWKALDTKFQISWRLKVTYLFPDEARSQWESPPLVDASVSCLSKKTTLPVLGASSLKEVSDRHLESALKAIYSTASVLLRSALVGSWVNKTVERWAEELSRGLEEHRPRVELRS